MISMIVFLPMTPRVTLPVRLLLFCLLSAYIISGCAGNVILSEDALRIRNTVDMINQLEHLYQERDEGMLSLFTPEYLSDTGMRDAITQDMKRFSSIKLSIFIEKIEVDGDLVNVSVHWNGSWDDGNKALREGGNAVIVIRSGAGLRTADIKGDSPFGISKK